MTATNLTCREYTDLQIEHLRTEVLLMAEQRDQAIKLARTEMEGRIEASRWSVGVMVTIITTAISIILFLIGKH